MMSSILDHTSKEYIKKLSSAKKMDAIEELALVFEGSTVCENTTELIKSLKEREEIMSTGIGFGIAIPHARLKAVKKMTFAIGISEKGIDFDSMDGEPVHLVILVAAGEKQHKEYLRLMSNIMGILKNPDVKDRMIKSQSPEEILNAFSM